MLDHIVFLSYLIIFLISTIGYGFLCQIFLFRNSSELNFGYLGILGFFTIILISSISSFFLAHNFLHNIILHSFGVCIFFSNIFKYKLESLKEIKGLLIVFFIFLIGVYVFKNHDDFPYYH